MGARAPGVAAIGHRRIRRRPIGVATKGEVVARITTFHIPRGGLRLQAAPITFQAALDARQGACEDPSVGEAWPTEPVVRPLGSAVIVGVATVVRPGLGRPIGRLPGGSGQGDTATPATGVRHTEVVALPGST